MLNKNRHYPVFAKRVKNLLVVAYAVKNTLISLGSLLDFRWRELNFIVQSQPIKSWKRTVHS